VVFAKTEVIGLLEEGIPENNVIAAYSSAMAHRVAELLNRLGVEEKIVVTGGIAKNEGIVRRLEQELGVKSAELEWYDPEMREKGVPFDSQVAGALGAAVFGYTLLERGKAKSAREG